MTYHRTVLPAEVMEYLAVKPEGWYLDATLGDGGHTLLIAQAGGRVWALDQDEEALARSEARLVNEGLKPLVMDDFHAVTSDTRLVLTRGNFEHLAEYWKKLNLPPLDGILFDLGASTLQLTSDTRGFSFNSDSPLDMRMDRTSGVTARDLVNALSEKELTRLFGELGGEHSARTLAKAIVAARKSAPLATAKQLADLIARHKPGAGKLHPATKVFQALRMAVNRERPVLIAALTATLEILKPQGRLVLIAFHEGEDAIVKHFFKDQADLNRLHILTSKPVTPTAAEINHNPRARSAKLRAASIL